MGVKVLEIHSTMAMAARWGGPSAVGCAGFSEPVSNTGKKYLQSRNLPFANTCPHLQPSLPVTGELLGQRRLFPSGLSGGHF